MTDPAVKLRRGREHAAPVIKRVLPPNVAPYPLVGLCSTTIINGNRAVDEWLSVFDDPILANSTLDGLPNASYQIVIEDTR